MRQAAEVAGTSKGWLLTHQPWTELGLNESKNLGILRLENLAPSAQRLTSDKTNLLICMSPGGLPSRERRTATEEIAEVTDCISEEGLAVVVLPNYYRSFEEDGFSELLKERGLSVTAVINPPAPFSRMGLKPVFVLVSRRNLTKILYFNCEISGSVNLLAVNDSQHVSGKMEEGIWLEPEAFTSFEHWKVQAEVDQLASEFGHFENCQLKDISVLNPGRVGISFQDVPNCVYLPVIGNGPAETDLSRLEMNHRWYIQLVVDEKRANSQYVCGFLNTRYFRLLLEAEKESRSPQFSRLPLKAAGKLPISLPSLEVQREIGEGAAKISRLRALVNDLTHQYSINPLSRANDQLINDSLQVFGRLSEEEQALSLIRSGESLFAEFKLTFSLDSETKGANTELVLASVKTIAAFLNTRGGVLLVGVRNDGQVIGLEEEIERLYGNKRNKVGKHVDKNDEFLQFVNSKIMYHLGAQHLKNIDLDLINVVGKTLLRVTCRESDQQVWLKKKSEPDSFYMRATPASQKLEGRELTDYIISRFGPTSGNAP